MDSDNQTPNYSQEEINKGQRRINYELCEVDTKLIEAMKALLCVLKEPRTPAQTSQGLRPADFSTVEAVLSEATRINDEVADIKPPGCLGPYSD